MKLPIALSSKKIVAVLNLLNGELRRVSRFPFVLGASGNADWKLSGWDREAGCSINKNGSDISLTPLTGTQNGQLFLNDESFTGVMNLADDAIYSLKIASNLFAVARVTNPETWAASVQTGAWEVFNGHTGANLGTTSIDLIGSLITQMNQNLEDCLAKPPGLNTTAFWVGNLSEWMSQPEEPDPAATPSPVPPPSAAPAAEPTPKETLDGNVGQFTCPVCWLKFDGKHLKQIAAHPDLKGDEKLGPDAMQRFVPVKFDDNGDPLDSLGQLAPDIACPHCHNRLPVGFTEMKGNILSIVGAPSSGKSYYLAILISQLKKSLFRAFEIAFGDQDPEYNIQLNAVANQLFSAATPEDGAIEKTQMRGDNYRAIRRGGKEVLLPKPYFYVSSRIGVEGSEKSFVFYDNAGEHFLPQNATAEDFHIEHVARASSLFFLFDPVSNIEFKRRLRGQENAQLKLPRYEPDNQDVILSQMNVKIKRALGKPFAEKLTVPLAILINKCDLWYSLMGDWEKLQDPLEKGCLNLEVLERNSRLIRKFMEDINPSIVATAERISSQVRYFPVSAFGHKPASYTDSEGKEAIAPEPEKIEPMMIETPTIWAMSKISSGLIPVKEPAE